MMSRKRATREVSSRSAPRPVGSVVAVRSDGQIAGSVSGGCIEDDLIARMREKALAAQPTLEGRVTVQFTIDTDGSVSQSSVQSSTLKHPPTETCITDAVKLWQFPKPVGGIVKVAYPFVLRTADEAPAEPKRLRAALPAQP